MADPRKSLVSTNGTLNIYCAACCMHLASLWNLDDYAGTAVLSPLDLSANDG
jgi:hypothetical protein